MGTGNTHGLKTYHTQYTVQPRGYGEHPFVGVISEGTPGSAPWVRGTLTNQHQRNNQRTVQPRGYGEHCKTLRLRCMRCGSAPWVRGTQTKKADKAKRMRFSPVGTGNTFYTHAACVRATVQPRGYGEHRLYALRSYVLRGSAPWVRGTHHSGVCCQLLDRFSPVGTGNTLIKIASGFTFAVQPRGYGEHPLRLTLSSHTGGSAPWVRGTHVFSASRFFHRRFSPVGTGNT